MPGEMAYYPIDIDPDRDRVITDPCKVGGGVIRQRAGRRMKTET